MPSPITPSVTTEPITFQPGTLDGSCATPKGSERTAATTVVPKAIVAGGSSRSCRAAASDEAA